MKVVIQRVSSAAVHTGGQQVGEIGRGILLLLGVEQGDTEQGADWLLEKVIRLRIFEDEDRKMNRSLLDIGGELLVVSQFTLAGNCNKGRRPSFDTAAPPEQAEQLYDYFVEQAKKSGLKVATGTFQADMQVSLVNDGPVTFVLER